MDNLVKFTPPYPLSEFIDYLYISNSQISAFEARKHRQGTHPKILVYDITQNAATASELQGLCVSVRNRNNFLDQNLNIGICFKPYGLHAGYNLNGEMLNNRSLAPETFLGGHWKLLPESISQSTTIEKIEFLNQALYKSLKPRTVLFEIAEIVDELIKADLTKGVQQNLADAFERTPKSFISLFKRAIGITPLQYLHMHKIEAAKELLLKSKSFTITEVAYTLGFYDQAHFIKIFKTYTGQSPKAFQKLYTTG